jgi:hypothetical protein
MKTSKYDPNKPAFPPMPYRSCGQCKFMEPRGGTLYVCRQRKIVEVYPNTTITILDRVEPSDRACPLYQEGYAF